MPKARVRQAQKTSLAHLEPMEARSVEVLPEGPNWRYEPKWDGFRCILLRDGSTVELRSKRGEDLTRYFPELADAASRLKPTCFALDGELVIPQGKSLSFDALLQRIHPAASRVAKLAAETPSVFVAFDILTFGKSTHIDAPLAKRRPQLEKFWKTVGDNQRFALSPSTMSLTTARRWLLAAGGGVDGVIAKRDDLPYQAGNRDGMQKIKRYRSADCVVGGFRYAEKPIAGRKAIGSLLLGLFDNEGLLHHVGFTSAFNAFEKRRLADELGKLKTEKSFTGNTPGGPSRWSTRRSSEWIAVKPIFVVEVSYDHFSEGRFRHGTKIRRWRPDKKARQCTFDQLQQKTLDLRSLMKN